MYQVEVVWNREFKFVKYGDAYDDLSEAIKYVEDLKNSGDGERVKKARVLDDEDRLVWPVYKKDIL